MYSYWDNGFLKLYSGFFGLLSKIIEKSKEYSHIPRNVCDVYKEVKSPLKMLKDIYGKHSEHLLFLPYWVVINPSSE